MENLRFGRLTAQADEAKFAKAMAATAAGGAVDGDILGKYFEKLAKSADIHAYPETIDRTASHESQPAAVLGSAASFDDLRALMLGGTDVVAFIHGFSVSWHHAVGSALALQCVLNRGDGALSDQAVAVLLFSWPSDGMALPFVSYKSDRSEAAGSGYAIGRAFLKLRDFLVRLGHDGCGQDIHLFCHSIGNFVLQNALARMDGHTPGNALPHVFLCAPDVDEGALDPGQPLGRVHEIAHTVIFDDKLGDKAKYVSKCIKSKAEGRAPGDTAHA